MSRAAIERFEVWLHRPQIQRNDESEINLKRENVDCDRHSQSCPLFHDDRKDSLE